MHKVLVNALSVTNPSGRHVLLGHLEQVTAGLAGRFRFVVLCRADAEEFHQRLGDRVEWVSAPRATRGWFARAIWERLNLARLARQQGTAFYFTPSGIAAHLPAHVAQIVFCQNPWALVAAARRWRDAPKAWLQRRAYRRAMRVAAAMVFNSRYMQAAYRANAGFAEKCGRVVHQAADDSTRSRAAARSSIARKPGQILSVSVMAPHKNAEALVRAFQVVHAQHPESTLILAGSWPNSAYEHHIRALVDSLGLREAVDFAGFVAREQLDRLYAESQVFALMSRCESFGIPAIEAQLFGTPVVSSSVCAIPEICGAGGLFCDPDDIAGLTVALKTLIENPLEWRRLSSLAQENAERFAWNRCSGPLVDLFIELAGRAEPPERSRVRAVWGWGMVVLAGIFPFAADMLRNFQLFTPAQLAWSFGGVALGASAVFAATAAGIWLATASARRRGTPPAPWLERVAYGLAAAAVLAVLMFDSNMTDLRFGFGLSRPAAVAGVAALFAGYWALAAKLGTKRTCALLTALIAVSALQAAWRVSVATDRGDELLTAEEIRIFRNVELAQTPNIYLIVLESYHGFRAMEELYGFDNTGFRRFLENRGFEIADEVVANYSFTMASLQSLFQMGHHYAAGTFGNHDSLHARGFLAGSARYFNPVLNILKRNGYSIVFLLPSDYYYRPGTGLVDHSLLDRSWPLAPLKVSLPRFIGREPDTMVSDYERKVADTVAGWPADAPAFFFIKLGAEHTADGYDYRTDRDRFAAHYVRTVERENPILAALCRRIIAKDPAGIVILAGDHGALSYQSHRRTPPEVLAEDGIPADRLVRDSHDVLLAIRWGEDLTPESFPFRSLVNLMRFVCYRLSGDEALMRTAAPDAAYILDRGGLRQTVADGHPLAEWPWVPRKGWK